MQLNILIIMKQANRTKIQKPYRKILNQYHFLNKNIDVYSISSFGELIESLLSQTLSFNDTQSKANIPVKIECLMSIIQKQIPQVTLSLIVKKVMLIFMLMRRLIREEVMSETLQEVFHKQINQIMKEDISKLTAPPRKREGSINKIYKYIRQLSNSKDKYGSPMGKTNIEGQSDKGAVKEIVSHIIEPFCLYMLKILQNKQFYFSLFRPESFLNSIQELPWKIINYSKMLGQISFQMYRLTRYFTLDIISICVFMTLLCSKDLALYYDILRECAEDRIDEMKEKIREFQQKSFSENEEPYRGIQVKEVREIKEFVSEIMAIRQKLHYIFGNKHCKDFKSYFSKPNYYSLMGEAHIESFQFILSYYSKATKLEYKSKSLKKIKASQPNIFTQSIFSHDSSQIFSSPEIPEAEIYLGSENDYKLVEVGKAKSRMNSWVGRGAKGKLFVEEDVVSTKGTA